jgi:hypothetical protein
MDPVTAILAAASIAGAIRGGQRKHIDPEWLRANYGAHAVTQEAQDLFARMVNSPQGQAIQRQASETGQQFANQTQGQAAAAGLTPMSGSASGTGIFATGAGEGAANTLNTQAKANIYASVLPVAQDIVNERKNAYMQDFYNNGAPTQGALQWQKVGNAAGIALSAAKPGQNSTSAPVQNVGAAGSIRNFQPKAVSLGQPVIGGSMGGFRLPQYNPQYGFLQKSRRLMGSLGNRFVTAFTPQPQGA